MAQVIVGRPFPELELTDKMRLEPSAIFHLFGGEPLAPATASFLRQIRERAFLPLQSFEFTHEHFSDGWRESIPGTGNINKVRAVIVAEDQRIERRASDGVAADDEFLAFVYSHFGPGSRPFTGF